MNQYGNTIAAIDKSQFTRTLNCITLTADPDDSTTQRSNSYDLNGNMYAFNGMGCSWRGSDEANCGYRLMMVNVPYDVTNIATQFYKFQRVFLDSSILDPISSPSIEHTLGQNEPFCPTGYLVCNYQVSGGKTSPDYIITCCMIKSIYTYSPNRLITRMFYVYGKSVFGQDDIYICPVNSFISGIDCTTNRQCNMYCQELMLKPTTQQMQSALVGSGYNCEPSAYKVCNFDKPSKFQSGIANFYMYDVNLFQAYQGQTQLAFGQQKYMCRVQTYYSQLLNGKKLSFQYRLINKEKSPLIVIPSDVWEGCYCPFMSLRMYVSYNTWLTAPSPSIIENATSLSRFFENTVLSQFSSSDTTNEINTVEGGHNVYNAKMSVSACTSDTTCPYDAPFFNPYGDDETARYLYDPQGSDHGVPMPVAFCRCSNGWDPIMQIAIFNNITTSLQFTPSRMYLCLSSKSSVHDDRINIQRNRFNGAVSMLNFTKTYNASVLPQAGWVSTITLDCYDKTMFEISALGFIFPICNKGPTGAFIPKRYHTLFNEKQNFSSGYEYFSNVPASSVYSNPVGNLTFNPSSSATPQFEFSTRAKTDAFAMDTIVGQLHATTYSNAYVIVSGSTTNDPGYFHVKLKCIFANVFSQRMIKRAFPVTTFSAYNFPDNVDGASSIGRIHSCGFKAIAQTHSSIRFTTRRFCTALGRVRTI
jgi:hypothetical protein